MHFQIKGLIFHNSIGFYEMVIDVNAILKMDAQQVTAWLNNALYNDIDDSSEFNWLGLAEGCAFNSHIELKNKLNHKSALEWASTAISIYEKLSSNVDKNDTSEYRNSAMRIRASLIEKLGHQSGHFVLDTQKILSWFYDTLPWDYELTHEKASIWQKLSINEIRDLRRLKNRITIIEILMRGDILQNEIAINKWVTLKNQLP